MAKKVTAPVFRASPNRSINVRGDYCGSFAEPQPVRIRCGGDSGSTFQANLPILGLVKDAEKEMSLMPNVELRSASRARRMANVALLLVATSILTGCAGLTSGRFGNTRGADQKRVEQFEESADTRVESANRPDRSQIQPASFLTSRAFRPGQQNCSSPMG